MPLAFSMTADTYRANGVKCLVYGPSGAGKTMLVATLPSPILLSAESGILSLSPNNIARVFGANAQGISYNIPIIQIRTVDDLIEAHQWFLTNPQSRQFTSVAIDSLTEIAEVVLSNAKKIVKDPRQAYGELLEKMTVTIRSFRDLPGRNVVMTAKMEPSRDEMSGITKYAPAMPGSKLGPQLPYFFDEVLRLGVSKTQQGQPFRFLQTSPDLQYDCKDRSGMLEPLETPHLGYLFHKIMSA